MANDVAAPLPQVILQPGSIITVTLDQAGAKVTSLNVHGYQDDAVTEDPEPTTTANPTGAYLPGEGMAA